MKLQSLSVFVLAAVFGSTQAFATSRRGGDRAKKLGALVEACPIEALACGLQLPDTHPESPDFAAVRESIQCLKEWDVATVDDQCASVLTKLQEGRPTGQNGPGKKLGALVEACPIEAAACGFPDARPENPNFAAVRESIQCMKEIDITTVSADCAVALEKLHGGRPGRPGREEKLDALWEACPVEAAQCGVPTTLPSIESEFQALKASIQCLREIDVTTVDDACAAVLERLQQQRPVSRRSSRAN